MKTKTTIISIFLVFCLFGSVFAQDGEVPGDANCDGVVNVLDVIVIANYFAGHEPDPFCFENADVNGDGVINVQDIILTLDIFLGEGTVIDIDGNVYQTVIIGDQEWMAENLRVTRYNNGDGIPTGLSDADWESTTVGAYAIYPHEGGYTEDDVEGINSDAEMVAAYGKLYNWYAVDDTRGLCPEGWTVPSHDDWTQLEQFICNALGNSDCETHFPYDNTTIGGRGTNEGNALKSCRQVDHDDEDCNTSEHPRWNYDSIHFGFDAFGFSALPGGDRGGNGNYYLIGYGGNWWSSSEYSSTDAWRRYIYSHYGNVLRDIIYGKSLGASVRCVKNIE